MLTHIHIKNLTIIEELTLDLTPGLSIITGETGAGKSIWVDAIQLALGSRADTHLIRQEAKRGEITLCFDISLNTLAKEWLSEQALDEDASNCIIRRVIEQNSRSRCSINGRPVGVNQLHEFAQFILAIHSQHQHQNLLKEDGQQSQIDQFACLENYLIQTKQLFCQWQQLEQEKKGLQNQLANREAELEWLNYQLAEIQELAPQEDEWEKLTQQHQELFHSENSLQISNQCLKILLENDRLAIIPLLQKIQNDLKSLNQSSKSIKNINELITQADIYLHEAANELKNLLSQVEINPEKLRNLEQRINKIHQLARKHQIEPAALWQIESQLAEKFFRLKQAEERITHIHDQQAEVLKQYATIANELTAKRQHAAERIGNKVTQFMSNLGMKEGCFIIKLVPRNTQIHSLGQEKISFWVTTNPGQEPQPLYKIVSGGELSRIHLALQVVLAEKAQTPTLIFDEVDVGISGQTAAIVGKLLKQLSANTQVICITHQPQVAAFGHQHYQVSKQIQRQKTFSQINLLNQTARIEELARMLGGTKITKQTRAHAAELLTLE